MNRLFTPTMGPADWRRLLADPGKQWKPSKSALEMAVCWESARRTERGLPLEVEGVLDSCDATSGAGLLMGVPEHRVSFAGGGHDSQNDLWALLRVGNLHISMTVEAKAGEKLDDLVHDWLPSPGSRSRKPERLAELRKHLDLEDADLGTIRYQLLHRSASALKEAERFGAAIAIMLVQSFAPKKDRESLKDLEAFGRLMGVSIEENALAKSSRSTPVPLFLGWVSSRPADFERLFAAV